jgi:hypothetical protein
MSRTWITGVVVLLCGAGFAYSQGWFDWTRSGPEIESNKVSTSQVLDQPTAQEGPTQVMPQATEAAAKPQQ